MSSEADQVRDVLDDQTSKVSPRSRIELIMYS